MYFILIYFPFFSHIGVCSAPVSSKHKHQTHNFDYHQLPYNNQHHTWHSGNAPPKHVYAQSQMQKAKNFKF